MASRKPPSAARVDSARQYLAQQASAGAWKPTKSLDSYSPGQLVRKAGAFRRQEAAGLAPSNRAARGHATTREHPNRKAPQLTQYQNLPRVRRPRITHTRPNIPRRVDHPRSSPTSRGPVYTVAHQRPGLIITALRDGKASGFHAILQAFDCSQHRWARVPLQPRQSVAQPAADYLASWRRSRKSLERWALDLINANDSPTLGGGGFTHICFWQVTLYPAPQSAVA